MAEQESAHEGLEKFRMFFERSGDPMQMLRDGEFIECNLATARALGYETTGEFLNVHPAELSPEYQPDGKTSNEKAFEMLELALKNGTHRFEWIHKKKTGDEFPVEVMLTSVMSEEQSIFYAVWTDISGRKDAESARQALELQLRQSEKMNAVGQLAGGVAHDFNNLLQAMMGYAEIAVQQLSETDRVRGDVEEVIKAAKRAADLVGQLLAFGRRQVLDLNIHDVDGIVDEFSKMVRRIIGEHIAFTFDSGAGKKKACVDRGQLEQIIMNLCVNGRDAMPDGGRLTIRTEIVELDESFCAENEWAEIGEYVVLSVTDTGVGMDENTTRRIFEPFFTTKKVGEGTGLGLSTVYGIVRQHKGMVHVVSTPGEGSTFEIFLPKTDAIPEEHQDQSKIEIRGGTETILFAEDDALVRNASTRILESMGYTVIVAENGEEAIAKIDDHRDIIQFALLDVVMPKKGGRIVWEHVRDSGLSVPILFTSGYSTNDVHTDFVLDRGMALIRKPYHRDDLLRRVRTMLDA